MRCARVIVWALLATAGCAHEVTLQPLAPGVWLHVTRAEGVAANGLYIETDGGGVLVDAGWNDAHAKRSLLAQVFARSLAEKSCPELATLTAVRAAALRSELASRANQLTRQAKTGGRGKCDVVHV
jgi:hypothetical protein